MATQVFTNMIGRVIAEVSGKVGDETLRFNCADGSSFEFSHDQDCCESVKIEDIAGDLADLAGSPILQAELVSNDQGGEPRPENADSWTWSFYKFRTQKGDVTVRFLGESNGYYGETVEYRETLT